MKWPNETNNPPLIPLKMGNLTPNYSQLLRKFHFTTILQVFFGKYGTDNLNCMLKVFQHRLIHQYSSNEFTENSRQ